MFLFHSLCPSLLPCPYVEVKKTLKRSKLSLVDLAGSERLAKTEATGDRLKEALHINKSLSALGDVIASLTSRKGHVPFRNSKLTHLLSDSLGADCKTLLFVNVSPAATNLSESACSLMFASRARNVDLSSGGTNAAGAVARWKAAANQAGDRIRIKEEELASALARISELQSVGKSQEGKEKERVKELKEKLKEVRDADKKSKRERSELQEALRVAHEKIKQLEASVSSAKTVTQQEEREGVMNELQQRHEALLKKL